MAARLIKAVRNLKRKTLKIFAKAHVLNRVSFKGPCAEKSVRGFLVFGVVFMAGVHGQASGWGRTLLSSFRV
ncbi:hypothetical protein R50076_23960 [Gilvimarinus japonicus]